MGLTQNLGLLSTAIKATSTLNVGIGTSSPISILNVKQTTNAQGLFVESHLNDTRFTFSIVGTTEARVASTYTTTGSYLPITFFTSDLERIRVTSTGNLGIGTSSPADILTISKATYPQIRLIETTTSPNTNCIFGYDSPSQEWRIRSIQAYPLTFGTSDTERIRITGGSGDVHINHNATLFTARFGIYESTTKWAQIIRHDRTAGQFFIQFQYNGSEIGAISGNASNTTYATSSDYRLKEDLKDFNGLDLVSKLNVYDFAWKSDNTRRMYGVVAHEMAEILPYAVNKEKDLVKEDGAIDAQGVDYSLITPLLVKAIQELKAELEALKNK